MDYPSIRHRVLHGLGCFGNRSGQSLGLAIEVEVLGRSYRSGHPAGVLVSLEEYEGLLETLEILADEELLKAVEEGLADLAAGHVVEHEELWDDVEADVRR